MDKLLREIIEEDKEYYFDRGMKRLYRFLTHNPLYQRGRYILVCRKAGYYSLHQDSLINKILAVYYARRKNILGERLSIELGPAEFGRRLKLYHGNIVINYQTVIGDDCEFYGSNCIGNKGTSFDDVSPVIGNRVSVGVGGIVIGNVKVADGIKISSGSMVNKNLDMEDSLYGGVPAVFIKKLY